MTLTKFDYELGIAIIEVYEGLNKKSWDKLQFPSIKQLQHAHDVKNLMEKLKEGLEDAKIVEKGKDSQTGDLFAEKS